MNTKYQSEIGGLYILADQKHREIEKTCRILLGLLLSTNKISAYINFYKVIQSEFRIQSLAGIYAFVELLRVPGSLLRDFFFIV